MTKFLLHGGLEIMEKKYELVETSIVLHWEDRDIELHRIRALKDIPEAMVVAGDLGGLIESEENLSHEGKCWVYGNDTDIGIGDVACVFGNARVYEDATVEGNCWVYGNAKIHGNACIDGNAFVYEDAEVCGDNIIRGEIFIHGKAKIVGKVDIVGHGIVINENAFIESPRDIMWVCYPYENVDLPVTATFCRTADGGTTFEALTNDIDICPEKHDIMFQICDLVSSVTMNDEEMQTFLSKKMGLSK